MSSLPNPPKSRPLGQFDQASLPPPDPDAADARIREYEYQSLLSEVAHLEMLAAQRGSTPSLRISNLEDRPYAVRLIESAAAGRFLSMVQRSATALRPLLRRLKSVARQSHVLTKHRNEASLHPELDDSRLASAVLVRRPRVLLDVTPSFLQPSAGGGIPRTVRSLAKAAVETGLALPVVIENGELRSYYRHPTLLEPIVPGPGDVYVVIDIFWYFLQEYSAIISSVRQRGAKLALVLYDILPLRYPSLYPEEVPRTFERGLREFLPQCDYCVSISKGTENDALDYLKESKLSTRDSIVFRHFHLGLDPQAPPSGDVRPELEAAFCSDNTFLSVGTLEPRKGYAIALGACDKAWASGADFRFVIVGRYGWRSQALRERILGHQEFGVRLFWFSDANDREVAYAYSRCRALIQSSVAEGFGLPILEAARLGAPIIASDLPVFREFGQTALSYFPVGSEEALANLIRSFLTLPRVSPVIPANTWAESMRELAACLLPDRRP